MWDMLLRGIVGRSTSYPGQVPMNSRGYASAEGEDENCGMDMCVTPARQWWSRYLAVILSYAK